MGPVTALWLVLVLIGGLGAGGWYLRGYLNSCGEGVEQLNGECIGVTDGSFVFMPELADVSQRIKEENQKVSDADPHATIALMIPMTSDHPQVRRQILHEVQGAYLAQYRANHDENENPPKIRLVLANPGRHRTEWRPVSDQLAAMAASPRDNLRVVFGFDLSVRPTKDAISYLTNTKGIPVVGGPITADDLANADDDHVRFDGLARVVPTNSDQAAALAAFDKDLDLRRAVLIEDHRKGDDYVATLRKAFEQKLGNSPHDSQVYVSQGPEEEGWLSSEFKLMALNMCAATPRIDTVYFAGRPVHLRQFVNALAEERPCKSRTFTVISGSGASTLYSDRKLAWEALRDDPESGRRGITVQYSSVSHPDAWVTGKPPETGGSPSAMRKLLDLASRAQAGTTVGPVGEIDLVDSKAISSYDSAWTAITGIRLHAHEGRIPGLRQIADDWGALQGYGKVDGASGWICLDTVGNPYNKAVSVLRLDPARKQPRFVGIAWPKGKPPIKAPDGACQVPKEK